VVVGDDELAGAVVGDGHRVVRGRASDEQGAVVEPHRARVPARLQGLDARAPLTDPGPGVLAITHGASLREMDIGRRADRATGRGTALARPRTGHGEASGPARAANIAPPGERSPRLPNRRAAQRCVPAA